MSPGQTGHITGQMGRVPGTDGTHTRGCPAKILYLYWFFLSLNNETPELFTGLVLLDSQKRLSKGRKEAHKLWSSNMSTYQVLLFAKYLP